tara:strand:- start:2510 stop:2773 length:264 start_codon:yes stop_codon:yes gene_type:complete
MFNKAKNFFYLLLIAIFLYLVINYYFSSQNIRNTNKSRAINSANAITDIEDLPLLQNDTKNIIEYKDDVEVYKKKKKKYKFFDLLKK